MSRINKSECFFSDLKQLLILSFFGPSLPARTRRRRPPVSAHPSEHRLSYPAAEQRFAAYQTRAGGRQRLLPV